MKVEQKDTLDQEQIGHFSEIESSIREEDIGFALAAVSQLTLIALGTIGVAIAFIYLNLSKQGGNGGGAASGSGDPIGDILEDY